MLEMDTKLSYKINTKLTYNYISYCARADIDVLYNRRVSDLLIIYFNEIRRLRTDILFKLYPKIKKEMAR